MGQRVPDVLSPAVSPFAVPGWAVSTTLGVRSRISRRIFELEFVRTLASYMFHVTACLMSSGNMEIQPNDVELEVKFVLTAAVWR